MQVTGARNNVRDTGEGNLGKMFGSAFYSLGRKPETLRSMDTPSTVVPAAPVPASRRIPLTESSSL
jgi:hypothetical protein